MSDGLAEVLEKKIIEAGWKVGKKCYKLNKTFIVQRLVITAVTRKDKMEKVEMDMIADSLVFYIKKAKRRLGLRKGDRMDFAYLIDALCRTKCKFYHNEKVFVRESSWLERATLMKNIAYDVAFKVKRAA